MEEKSSVRKSRGRRQSNIAPLDRPYAIFLLRLSLLFSHCLTLISSLPAPLYHLSTFSDSSALPPFHLPISPPFLPLSHLSTTSRQILAQSSGSPLLGYWSPAPRRGACPSLGVCCTVVAVPSFVELCGHGNCARHIWNGTSSGIVRE